MAAWPHGDPDVVVRGILASAAYRHPAAAAIVPPKKTWLDALETSFHDRIWEPFVRSFLRPIARSLGASHDVWNLVGAAVVVLAVIVLIFAIYRLIVAFARSGSQRGSGRAGTAGVAILRGLSSGQWRERARDAARDGDYARAIAALFNAAIVTLDERAIVPFDAARTPGEYRRLVRRERATAAEPFGDLCTRFVRAAYAEEPTSAGDYAASERAYAAFEPAIA